MSQKLLGRGNKNLKYIALIVLIATISITAVFPAIYNSIVGPTENVRITLNLKYHYEARFSSSAADHDVSARAEIVDMWGSDGLTGSGFASSSEASRLPYAWFVVIEQLIVDGEDTLTAPIYVCYTFPERANVFDASTDYVFFRELTGVGKHMVLVQWGVREWYVPSLLAGQKKDVSIGTFKWTTQISDSEVVVTEGGETTTVTVQPEIQETITSMEWATPLFLILVLGASTVVVIVLVLMMYGPKLTKSLRL